MSPDAAVDLAYKHFIDTWGNATTAVTLEGEPFDPRPLAETGTPWVRFSVRHTGSEQHTLGAKGSRKYDRRAVAFIEVFAPPAKGRAILQGLVKTALGVFEGERVGELVFAASTPRERPPGDTWVSVVVETPFRYEEVK